MISNKENIELDGDLVIKSISPPEILKEKSLFDRVVIRISYDGKIEKVLPDNMIGEQFLRWRRGRSGIFFADLRKFRKGEDSGDWILADGNGQKLILKIIKEEDEELFRQLKLIDGRIKDRLYMKLCDLLQKDEKTKGYIEDEVSIENKEISMKNSTLPPKKTEGYTNPNISLFEG